MVNLLKINSMIKFFSKINIEIRNFFSYNKITYLKVLSHQHKKVYYLRRVAM